MKNKNIKVVNLELKHSSGLYLYELENEDWIYLTQIEFEDMFEDGESKEVESAKDKIYTPVFSVDGNEVTGFDYKGDRQFTLDDVYEFSRQLLITGNKSSLVVYETKEIFFKKNGYEEEYEKEEWSDMLQNFEDDDLVIMLYHGNGENYVYGVDDIQELMTDESLFR